MIDIEMSDKEGWEVPLYSRQHHYFVNGKSLCNIQYDKVNPPFFNPRKTMKMLKKKMNIKPNQYCKECDRGLNIRLMSKLEKFFNGN